MSIPIEIIVGLITLCGVLTTATINMFNSKHKNSSDQTMETMKVQKELIDTLFSENQILSKRMDEIELEQITKLDEDNHVDKLDMAKRRITSHLEKYNIYMTETQLETFIESAVKQMNDAWKD